MNWPSTQSGDSSMTNCILNTLPHSKNVCGKLSSFPWPAGLTCNTCCDLPSRLIWSFDFLTCIISFFLLLCFLNCNYCKHSTPSKQSVQNHHCYAYTSPFRFTLATPPDTAATIFCHCCFCSDSDLIIHRIQIFFFFF